MSVRNSWKYNNYKNLDEYVIIQSKYIYIGEKILQFILTISTCESLIRMKTKRIFIIKIFGNGLLTRNLWDFIWPSDTFRYHFRFNGIQVI